MRTTIDKAGRIVVPKALRVAARLGPGTEIEIRLRGNVIEIEPAPHAVEVERRGRFSVAVPRTPGPVLTAAAIEQTRQDVDEGRR